LNSVPSGSGGSDTGSGANGGGFGMQGSHGASTGGFNASAVAPVASAAEQEPDGPVCVMRPGDVGFDECEACQ
jgi:ribonucleoside-diphosphate reductase alpha chain